MAFVGVEDLTASGEVTFFTEELMQSRELLHSDQPLLLTATIDNRDTGNTSSFTESDSDEDAEEEGPREIKLRGISVQSLSEACKNSSAPVYWDIRASLLHSEEGLQTLKAILEKHKGGTEVQLGFNLNNVHCKVRLGAQWGVTPGPEFRQDMHRWTSAAS